MKMGFEVSDELLGTFVPVLIYWAYSGIYVLLDSFENYRLHTRKDEDEKNLVSKRTVVKGVLLQQTIQAIVAIILFTVLITSSLSFSVETQFGFNFTFSLNSKYDLLDAANILGYKLGIITCFMGIYWCL